MIAFNITTPNPSDSLKVERRPGYWRDNQNPKDVGYGGKGDILVKGYKTSVTRSSGNLMYSMLTVVNNNVLYT